MRATIQAPGVEKDPPAADFRQFEYGDFGDHLSDQVHNDDPRRLLRSARSAIYTNAWYEFRRHKITIPYPSAHSHLERNLLDRPRRSRRAREILRVRTGV